MEDGTPDFRTTAGAADLAARAADLADHLPEGLKPLAPVAYNYRWSWLPGGEDVLREINPHRWELARVDGHRSERNRTGFPAASSQRCGLISRSTSSPPGSQLQR